MCTAKLKFPVIILANESNVHCKIEIFSHHFCQLEQCALYILKFQTIILPHVQKNRSIKIGNLGVKISNLGVKISNPAPKLLRSLYVMFKKTEASKSAT